MVKRTIECCDFCKEEAELKATIEIKKGNKKGRTYELCVTCAETLEQRLVSIDVPSPKTKASAKIQNSEEDDDVLTLDDGSTKDIPHREEFTQDIEEDIPLARALPKGKDEDGNDCQHLNRCPPRLNAKTHKLTYKCRDCNVNIPYVSAQQKKRELSGKLPPDVRMSDHSSEERRNRD